MATHLSDISAQQVEYYDTDIYEYTESRESYRVLREVSGVSDEYDYGRHTREVFVKATFYLHEATGLVVADIPKFETWLTTIKSITETED